MTRSGRCGRRLYVMASLSSASVTESKLRSYARVRGSAQRSTRPACRATMEGAPPCRASHSTEVRWTMDLKGVGTNTTLRHSGPADRVAPPRWPRQTMTAEAETFDPGSGSASSTSPNFEAVLSDGVDDLGWPTRSRTATVRNDTGVLIVEVAGRRLALVTRADVVSPRGSGGDGRRAVDGHLLSGLQHGSRSGSDAWTARCGRFAEQALYNGLFLMRDDRESGTLLESHDR